MKRIIRLTESDLARIVRRVINENNDPFSSMYGKTVIFKPTGDIDDIVVDEWDGSALDNEPMDEKDERIWNKIKSDTIKGTITEIEVTTQNKLSIYITPLDSLFGEYRDNINVYFTCGSNEFVIEFNLNKYAPLLPRGYTFFSDKNFKGTYTCDKFSEYLNNHLPCGGFDLSKTDSMDDEDFGDTLS